MPNLEIRHTNECHPARGMIGLLPSILMICETMRPTKLPWWLTLQKILCYVWNRSSGCKFWWTQVSEYQASYKAKHPPSKGTALQAVNPSSIRSFGTHIVPLSMWTNVSQEFVNADVSQTLLGADFLCSSGLMVDLKGHRLIDTTTYAITSLSRATQVGRHISIVAVKANGPFADLLGEFPSITTPKFSSRVVKHGVEHFVQTQGPSISAWARHLPPDKLRRAKEEFSKLEALGIIHLSNSPRSSALLMVP